MTKININNISEYYADIPKIKSINFNFLGNKIYSATKVQQIYGTFVSNVVEASEYFLKWNEITWDDNKDSESNIWMYVKTASTQEELQITAWSGPYIDGAITLSDQYGKYLQFCAVIRKKYNATIDFPKIGDIKLKYFTSETASRFFTRTFNIGFTPKTVVLTYNADTADDAIIRFAISGMDTADTSYYQYIDSNKIVELDSLTYLSDNIKVMMELIGTSETQVVVNEFALMFSGEEAFRINKKYMESSSSTDSSSSSISSSSSSSSLDSSSSSSSSSHSSSSSSSSIDSSSSSSSSTSSSSSIDSSSSSSTSNSSSSSSSSEGNTTSSSTSSAP